MCASKVQQCPESLTGFTAVPAIEIPLVASDVESFPEDIQQGFCYQTIDDQQVVFYQEGIKQKFNEFLKGKVNSLFSATGPTDNIMAIEDLYWLGLTTKEDIDRMEAAPPPRLDLKKTFDGDWILLRKPFNERLIAQIRAAMGDVDNELFRRGIVDNSYFVVADMDKLTMINSLIYYVKIELENSGKPPEFIEKFAAGIAYEFTNHAYDILQKEEEERDAWLREGLNFLGMIVGFGILIPLLLRAVERRNRVDPFDPKGPMYQQLVNDVAERMAAMGREVELSDVLRDLKGGVARTDELPAVEPERILPRGRLGAFRKALEAYREARRADREARKMRESLRKGKE